MRFNEIRKIKMFANITFADISDTTGVSIFVKEILGAGVIVLIIVAVVFTAFRAYHKRRNCKDEGAPQQHDGVPRHLKAIFGKSPCYV